MNSDGRYGVCVIRCSRRQTGWNGNRQRTPAVLGKAPTHRAEVFGGEPCRSVYQERQTIRADVAACGKVRPSKPSGRAPLRCSQPVRHQWCIFSEWQGYSQPQRRSHSAASIRRHSHGGALSIRGGPHSRCPRLAKGRQVVGGQIDAGRYLSDPLKAELSSLCKVAGLSAAHTRCLPARSEERCQSLPSP